jgi:hypothetical protein
VNHVVSAWDVVAVGVDACKTGWIADTPGDN